MLSSSNSESCSCGALVYRDESRCLQNSMNAEAAISEKMANAAPDTNMAIEPVLSDHVVFFTSTIVATSLMPSLELFPVQPPVRTLQQPGMLWLELENSKPGRQEQLVFPLGLT